jgi:hypothetical protein
MITSRRVAILALLAALAGGAVASMGAPRLTLLNADVHVAYPWPQPAAALASAAAAAVLAILARRRWTRLAAGAFALAAALAAGHLLLYRVRAGAEVIEARGLLGTERLAWSAIAQVETASGLLLVTGTGGERVRVDTTDFRIEDRAALDRTIARRLRGGP